MTDFPAVGLPCCPPGGDPSELVRAIEEWTSAAALQELVRAFGGASPPLEVADRLEWLDMFSARYWDFRNGRERYESKKVKYGGYINDLVSRAGDSLGLSGRNRPAHDRYRHVLVAGGGVRTCAARSAFAAELVAGGLDTEEVAGLGSLRPVSDRELDHARSLGLTGIGTEFDAMDAGLRRAFHLGRPADDQLAPGAGSGGWRIRTYRSSTRTTHTLAAPSTEPATRRANTADTLRFWAEQVSRPEPTDLVLVITTDLHVPFQHCDAVRTLTLQYGCGVETVGLEPTALADPLLRHAYLPSDVLQELRSAIRSMRALHTALLALRMVPG
ncbi:MULTISPECIES: hypothetical protein [Micromonospora]|uniref:Uncharacterized protein n=1 Tax=Micromonospora sicca TaxID=2202420 RepID=A0A317DD50_9ACTN|nr:MULTISPECIES: hypothetical protein [unclassified Micromonospora]MBM0226909.1 hypothetical protein [Micromonospora sp. ATA51]PWR11676.1 hypothetical protein DKT69_26215 [Micromonospora sp. 4G51]